jgi:hypothetical protein
VATRRQNALVAEANRRAALLDASIERVRNGQQR